MWKKKEKKKAQQREKFEKNDNVGGDLDSNWMGSKEVEAVSMDYNFKMFSDDGTLVMFQFSITTPSIHCPSQNSNIAPDTSFSFTPLLSDLSHQYSLIWLPELLSSCHFSAVPLLPGQRHHHLDYYTSISTGFSASTLALPHFDQHIAADIPLQSTDILPIPWLIAWMANSTCPVRSNPAVFSSASPVWGSIMCCSIPALQPC